MGRQNNGLIDQASDVPNLILFSQFLAKSFSKIVSIYFFMIKIKSFECPKSIRNNEKKIMLGTSDAWSTSHLSQHPSEPVYYIVDCRIFTLILRLIRDIREKLVLSFC